MTRQQPLAVLAIAGLLAACQSAAPSTPPSVAPSASSAASASAPASASPSARPSAGPSFAVDERLTLSFDATEPFIIPADGPAGASYAMPGAAARDAGGRYLVFVRWFGEEGTDDPGVTLATSVDGATWDVRKDSIFDLEIGGPEPGPVPTAAVQLADGSWRLYGWADDPVNSRRFSSWTASAPTLDDPWTLDADDILEPGPPISWDSTAASIYSVVPTESGFAGWYEGQPPGSEPRGDFGYATSEDGIEWTKFDDPTTDDAIQVESDPVIDKGICGQGTAQAIYQPRVQRMGSDLVMVFAGWAPGAEGIDLYGAVSDDGITWTCASAEALLLASDIPNGSGIHGIATVRVDDDTIGVVIESLEETRSTLWWATVEVTP